MFLLRYPGVLPLAVEKAGVLTDRITPYKDSVTIEDDQYDGVNDDAGRFQATIGSTTNMHAIP